MSVKIALVAGWAIGLLFYLVDLGERVAGPYGFDPKTTDAIAVFVLVGSAAMIWGRKLRTE